MTRKVKGVTAVALLAGAAVATAAVWTYHGAGDHVMVRTDAERAGPLLHGPNWWNKFVPTSIGTTLELGLTELDNTSSEKDATIVSVRPFGVTSGLHVLGTKVWRYPLDAKNITLLPLSHAGPITDPRIRDAVPAANVRVPPRTGAIVLVYIRPERKGTFQFGGLDVEVKAGHTRFLWHIADSAQVRALCTKSKGKYCNLPG